LKYIYILCALCLLLISCSRDWNSPLENDTDLLHQPHIVGITPDITEGFKLELDYSYSSAVMMLFERKIGSAYEPITLKKLSSSVYADTTLDMELDHTLSYRLKVQKGSYFTEYSNEKTYSYTSSILNAPSAFTLTSVELQGVRLNWHDNSNKETGYKIERNTDGAGYLEIASLPPNTQIYMNEISGMPEGSMNLFYRIKSYTSNLNSDWQVQNVIYSGLGAPTNLIIVDTTSYHFTINWSNNSTIATNYEIERKKDDGSYSLIQTVSSSVQTFTEQINAVGNYSYRIRAKKDNAYSSYSNVVTHQVNSLIPTVGLVAYYPFDGNANDAGQFGHNGTVYGANLTTDRFGEANRAYDFDGVNDYIEVPSSGNLSTSYSALTLSAWVNVRDWYLVGGNSGWASLIRKGANANSAIALQLEGISPTSDFGILFSNNNPSNTYYDQSSFSLNQWYNILVTMSNSNVKFYVNGTLTRSIQTNMYINSNSEPLLIGDDPPGANEYQNGKLDDLCIYNRALTEEEIQALYHEGGYSGKKSHK
jgi:hypothetical protein